MRVRSLIRSRFARLMECSLALDSCHTSDWGTWTGTSELEHPNVNFESHCSFSVHQNPFNVVPLFTKPTVVTVTE